MKLLSQFLAPENVVLDVPATSKKRALEQVALLLENNQGLERASVFDSLFARERLGSTGLGHGVAIPHGRIKNISKPSAAFVRLAQPVSFDAPDGEPVDLLLVIVVPEEATQQHLDILAEVARRLSEDSVIESLRAATQTSVVYELLTAKGESDDT